MAIIILDWFVARAGSVARVLGGRDGSRAGWLAAVASLGVLAATTASVVLVLRTPERLAPVALDPPPDLAIVETPAGTPGRGARPAASSPAPAPSGSRTPAPARPSAAPGTTPPTVTPAALAPLTAAFAVTDTALLSYGATVTIGNPGRGAVVSWMLVVTLPAESLEVTSVDGARASRDGSTWTFVPDGPTGGVPGGGSHRVSFRVDGSSISSLPTACTIDGVACTGLRE